MSADGIFEKQGPFIVVPTWVFDRLAPEHARVLQIYVALASYADRNGVCWPTLGAVGDLLQVDNKTVGRATARLEELGILRIEPQYRNDGSQMGNAYRLCPPPTPRVSAPHPTSVPAKELESLELEPITGESEIRDEKSISEQLWDALCLACKIRPEEITKTARGELNSAVKELKAVDATPREIMRRSVLYMLKFPGAALTPSALKKHWPQLVPVDRTVVELYPGSQTETPIGAVEMSEEDRERNQARIREMSEKFRAK